MFKYTDIIALNSSVIRLDLTKIEKTVTHNTQTFKKNVGTKSSFAP